jgi:hypothetical protein
VSDASGESGKDHAAVETTFSRAPALSLPDLGNTFLEPDPVAGSPGPGETRSEVDLLLEEFNTADSSSALPAAEGCRPRPIGAYLLALRRHFAAARVDNFVLRERVAALEQELASCRHQLAVAEWDCNAQQQYNLELKRGNATLHRELREAQASTSWRLANALRGLVRRASRWLRKGLRIKTTRAGIRGNGPRG